MSGFDVAVLLATITTISALTILFLWYVESGMGKFWRDECYKAWAERNELQQKLRLAEQENSRIAKAIAILKGEDKADE